MTGQRFALWPLGVLMLGALSVAWPLWNHPGSLGWLLEHGHWFPRWSPHMAWGYGFPFFNFYAPLSSYAVVALNALTTNYAEATRWAFALAVWLAGVSAFAAPTLGDMLTYELGTGTFGTTAKGEYQPRTSLAWPAATDLAEAIQRGEEPPIFLPRLAGDPQRPAGGRASHYAGRANHLQRVAGCA